MEKTLCQFGQVLFDELEQVAARRGGFASLTWLKDNDASLKAIRDGLGMLRDSTAADAGRSVTATALKARDYAERVQAAARAVQDLARIVQGRCRAARQVMQVAVSVTKAAEDTAIGRLDEAWAKLEPTEAKRPGVVQRAWAGAQARILSRAPKADEPVNEAVPGDAAGAAPPTPLSPASPWDQLAGAHRAYIEALRVHRQGAAVLARLDANPPPGGDLNASEFGLAEAWERFRKEAGSGDAEARMGYREALDALRETVKKADAAEASLRRAQQQERDTGQSQQDVAQACSIAATARRIVAEIVSPPSQNSNGGPGAPHSANGAPRGKTADDPGTLQEDGGEAGAKDPSPPDAQPRTSAMDQFVDCAEGAMNKALAMTEEALNEALKAYAALVDARQAAIDLTAEGRALETSVPPAPPGLIDRLKDRLGLRRGGDVIRYPDVLYEMDDILTDAARQAALDLNSVGLAFSGGGIRSATFNLGVLQALASLGLLGKVDYLSTVSGGGYIGSWLAAWVRREGGLAGDPAAAGPGSGEVDRKRSRTARALENVETQLRSNRSAQGRADRRWVTAEEVATGVEGQGRMLRRVVDEEPEPIYHLRQFSNYLAPKVGLSSADTWTMISVYLRNLMLNQFILLPLVLALVLIPRLLLGLFGLNLSGSPWHQAVEFVVAGLMIVTGAMAFGMTYRVIAKIRSSRGRPRDRRQAVADRTYEANLGYVAVFILLPLFVAALCFIVLFAHRVGDTTPAPWYLPSSLILWPWTTGADPQHFTASVAITAGAFGLFVGLIRFLSSLVAEFFTRPWEEPSGAGFRANAGYELRRVMAGLKRASFSFASAFFAIAGLYLVLAMIRGAIGEDSLLSPLLGGGVAAALTMQFEVGTHALLSPLLATLGVPLVILAAGVGASIEVGLIGGYKEEDMREWRASLGAYYLMIAALWAFFFGLSLYGPLLVWATNVAVAAAIAAGWISVSTLGVLAGRSARTGTAKDQGRSPLDYVALVAPVVFLTGLLVAIAALACALQGVPVPLDGRQDAGPRMYLGALVSAASVPRTWIVLLICAAIAGYNCFKINVNLFSMNLFYANRLVRCYLGASRPRAAPDEGRQNFAPSNCPVPARRPNPLTGFDPDDDFPMKDLAVVRTWDRRDLVCDYRGPYYLINTAMNLVAGSELAWQERMAESFLLSPLYCGSQSTGYRKALVTPDDVRDDPQPDPDDRNPDRGLVKGYGGDIRLGTAVSISGAAASPNMGYHSSPLVAVLMTVFNARLGMWLPNPAKPSWRNVGPGFASYLIDELTGKTTDKGRYVYLSDGGHFENLGVYELIRRRCRYVVVCDAGADPAFAFWDLGSLVRKCREDFGVRIEIDIAPLLKADGTSRSQRHCAVGTIRYDDIDAKATPGILFYLKPSLTGDESSDVRNYVVEHPDFPHESTSDQFFSESQFESYRQLGEHVATRVIGEAVRDTAGTPHPETLFRRLKRRWFPPLPDLDHKLLKSVEPFLKIHDTLRSDRRLGRLSRQLYPELYGDGEASEVTVRAEVHTVCQMLQAMENAWLAVDLEEFADHPMNRGWMNVLRRWTTSQAFQAYWPALRGEFSEGFVQFCENELNLNATPVETRRIGATICDAEFRRAVGQLDAEFLLEWPTLPWLGQSPRPVALTTMLAHVLSPSGKVEGLDHPAAWLIGSFPSDSTSPGLHRCYGVILGWMAEADVIGIMIWLRGAYRTLRIGRDAIEQALDQIKAERECKKPGRYTVRAGYPEADATGSRDQWQGSVWQNFLLAQGFRRYDPATTDIGLFVLERRFGW